MDALVESYLEIVDRLGLSDEEAAVAVGIATHTARIVRIARATPRRRDCIEKLTRFVRENSSARDRVDVRLAPRAVGGGDAR